MKFLKILGFFCLLLSWNCQTSQTILGYEILSATYSEKSYNEFDKGFLVNMEYQMPPNTQISYIILNQFKFKLVKIEKNNQGNYVVDAYFPVQSKMIQNFTPPKTDKRKDGIIFEIDGVEIYKEVKFKLK